MNIKIVYFACLVPDKWEYIIIEQLDSLKNITDLYSQAIIYMSVISNHTDLQKLQLLLKERYDKIILYNVYNENLYEYPGIKTVYNISENNDDTYILYFHSKGMVSNQHDTRRLLFKYTIENYKDAITAFQNNKNIDIVCPVPASRGFSFYNFFWVRSSYVYKYCVKPVCYNSFTKEEGRFYWESWLSKSSKSNIITYSPFIKFNTANDVYGANAIHNALLNYYFTNNDYYLKIIQNNDTFHKFLEFIEHKLDNICDNENTDKNTQHTYFDVYDNLLKNKRNSAKNILEIGIYNGGSIKLWNDYFHKADIYGIDENNNITIDSIKHNNKIHLYVNIKHPYHPLFFINEFSLSKINFDIIIDNGDHDINNQILFIKGYSNLLTQDGILIIESVQDINHIQTLIDVVPQELKKYIVVYDLRNKFNKFHEIRYDNILFVINKSLQTTE